MKESDVAVSAEQLRVQVRALAVPFSGIMEEAADDYLLEAAHDPENVRNALLWKINGIPAMHMTLFAQDPLAAIIDTWVLLAQMRLAHDDDLDGIADDPEGQRVLRAVDRMEDSIEDLARSTVANGDISFARDRVYELAMSSPIDSSFTTRPSTAAHIAAFESHTKPGLGAAVDTLTTSVGDVWARLDVYSAFIPKQARWQAELMVLDIVGGRDPGEALDDFATITRAIDQIAATVETAPGLVSEEREAVMLALQVERAIVLETLHDELVQSYDFISRERMAFSESVQVERKALLDALTQERMAVIEAIHAERITTMEDLESIAGGLSEDALARLVDRVFLRLALVLAVVFVVAGFVGFIAYRRITKNLHDSSSS